MIKNYLYSIGKLLPPKSKEEVLKEIEANLYDYLEEQFGEKEYTDKEYEEAIRSLGHPRKVAEAYNNGPRCLIGPAYFDIYWLVLKITIISIAIGNAASYIFSDSLNIGQFFNNLIAQTWNSSMNAIGVITLVFAVIHYYNPEFKESTDESWSLDELEEAPTSNQKVSLSELIAESFFIILGLVWLNKAAPFIAMNITSRVIIPGINMDAFSPFIIWINITLLASLILNVYLMVKGKWEMITRLFDSIINIASLVILLLLFFTPNLLDPTSLINILGTQETEKLVEVISLSGKIALVVITVLISFDIWKHVKYYLSRRD